MLCQEAERKSIRIKGRDYSLNGYYFVTLCTNDREDFFGEVKNGIMGLSDIGCIAAVLWQEIPEHFDNVELDEKIIMPNHIHGILKLKNWYFCCRGAINRAPTTEIHGGATGIYNPMGKNTLGEIIRWFKGRAAYEIRKIGYDGFFWQSRFYDHIIRNSDELNRIRKYIQKNPQKWQQDRNNPENLWM
jgi:REP element-mobilizing transposase RayT